MKSPWLIVTLSTIGLCQILKMLVVVNLSPFESVNLDTIIFTYGLNEGWNGLAEDLGAVNSLIHLWGGKILLSFFVVGVLCAHKKLDEYILTVMTVLLAANISHMVEFFCQGGVVDFIVYPYISGYAFNIEDLLILISVVVLSARVSYISYLIFANRDSGPFERVDQLLKANELRIKGRRLADCQKVRFEGH